MITYENNYINPVVLGSFNPAILTHSFLVEKCEFTHLRGEPARQVPPIPVVASLDYDTVSFFADLGRLQITEKKCTDPKASKVPDYLKTYLEKLPHTPITKCGANFSYMLNVNKTRLQSINEWLKSNRNKFLQILNLQKADLEVSFAIYQDSEIINSWTLRTKLAEDQATTMFRATVGQAGGQAKVDFNYEVADLDKERARLDSVTTDYHKIVDLFKNQVDKIFGG
jgi:hypothetical protein